MSLSIRTAVGVAGCSHAKRKVGRNCPGKANVVAMHAVTGLVRCVSVESGLPCLEASVDSHVLNSLLDPGHSP
jgi:hypothetical protein